MKALIITALLASLIAGCTKNNGGNSQQSNSLAQVQREESGGIDGGGGGTLPANPMSVHEVVDTIKQSKLRLDLIVKAQMLFAEDTHQPKFYEGPVTLWDVLQNTDVDVQNDGPCYDSYGNAVDGSVHSAKPNAVCISAFRIAPKLVKERGKIEIPALIIHELSHKLGATEEEAVDLQKTYAHLLSEVDEKELSDLQKALFYNAYQGMGSLQERIDSLSDADLLKRMNELNKSLLDAEKIFPQYPFSVVNHDEADALQGNNDQVMLGLWYLLSITGSDEEKQIWKSDLDKAFRGKQSVTAAEFEKNMYGVDDKTSQFVLVRIDSRAILKEQLKRVSASYKVFGQALRNLGFGSQMGPAFSRGVSASPFKNFIGEYRVVSTNCPANGWANTGFKIIDEGDTIELVKLHANGFGNDGWLIDGAEMNGGFAVQVSGDQNKATRVGELGDRWGSSFYQRIFQIKRAQNYFVVTESTLSRRATTDGWNDFTSSCTYNVELVK